VIKTIFSTSAKATTSLCLSFLQIGLTKELKDRVAIDILVTHFWKICKIDLQNTGLVSNFYLFLDHQSETTGIHILM